MTKKTFADISDEDIMAGRKLEVKTEKQTIVTGSRRSSAITDQHMLAKRKKMLQSMSKTLAENEGVPSIDWTMGVPFALHKPAKKNDAEGDDSDSDSDSDYGGFHSAQGSRKCLRHCRHLHKKSMLINHFCILKKEGNLVWPRHRRIANT